MPKEPSQANTPFKICPFCKTAWETREGFLNDPYIILVGYTPNFEVLSHSLFLFNHTCKGTLSVKAQCFMDLYKGPIFAKRLFGTEECSEYCLYKSNLAPCPAPCECAFMREILQVLKKMSS